MRPSWTEWACQTVPPTFSVVRTVTSRKMEGRFLVPMGFFANLNTILADVGLIALFTVES